MKRPTNKTTLTIALLALALFLTGCGSKKLTAGSTDSSSRLDNSIVTTTSTNKPLAQCNEGASELGHINLMIYKNSYGEVSNSFIKGKLSNLSTDFEADGNFIQIFRWKANSSGNSFRDSVPLKFRFLSQDGSNLSNYMSEVDFEGVKSIGSAKEMDVITAEDFFENASLLIDLRDPYAEFDAVQVVLFNKDNEPLSQIDLLIPTFYADPADYKIDTDGSARALVLMNLHPFSSQEGMGWTKEHFDTLTQNFCF